MPVLCHYWHSWHSWHSSWHEQCMVNSLLWTTGSPHESSSTHTCSRVGWARHMPHWPHRCPWAGPPGLHSSLLAGWHRDSLVNTSHHAVEKQRCNNDSSSSGACVTSMGASLAKVQCCEVCDESAAVGLGLALLRRACAAGV